MIIIICKKCGSAVSLTRRQKKACECGAAIGRYMGDRIHLSHDAVPLGVSNDSFLLALENRPDHTQDSFGAPVEVRVLARDQFTIDKE